jgi:isopentenyl diphosphate isomerase/L-lactate dehydrogenase-like FMN-dependent dehydrogenase
MLEIRKAVGEKIPLLLDGGIRSGADVVKGLALGADAVLIGKAYLYGLGVAGEQGVRKVIRGLVKELDAAMRLCGALKVGDLDQSMVARA